MENKHRQLIVKDCIVAVQQINGKKPLKVVRGDLCLDENDRLVLSGVNYNSDLGRCLFPIAKFGQIDLFPAEVNQIGLDQNNKAELELVYSDGYKIYGSARFFIFNAGNKLLNKVIDRFAPVGRR